MGKQIPCKTTQGGKMKLVEFKGVRKISSSSNQSLQIRIEPVLINPEFVLKVEENKTDFASRMSNKDTTVVGDKKLPKNIKLTNIYYSSGGHTVVLAKLAKVKQLLSVNENKDGEK